MQEEPEPFALVPAHAQLLTCCDFDAAGTRLLCGDAAGSVFLFTVPPGAPSSSSLLHRCAVGPLHLCSRAPLRTPPHPSAPSAPFAPPPAWPLKPGPSGTLSLSLCRRSFTELPIESPATVSPENQHIEADKLRSELAIADMTLVRNVFSTDEIPMETKGCAFAYLV